ncbi:MAG: hypothetical protein ACRCWO_02930 [Bosea sp. (in: a-proteobacteria)]
MLAEFAIHVFSPGRLAFRRVGLHDKAVALWSRATRCRSAWAAHEANCHEVVRAAMAALPSRRTALVLGSGLCRDFPLDELARSFERVVLVDAVHLWPVRMRLRQYRNVETRSRDLTGAVEWLIGKCEGRIAPLADFQGNEAVDFVLSANCLSQLPLGLDGWIDADAARKARWGEDFADQAIDWHLKDLAGFNCPVCLISDVEMVECDASGREVERIDLMRGRWEPPNPDASWEWLVVPQGEAARGHTSIHAVRAWKDIRPMLA